MCTLPYRKTETKGGFQMRTIKEMMKNEPNHAYVSIGEFQKRMLNRKDHKEFHMTPNYPNYSQDEFEKEGTYWEREFDKMSEDIINQGGLIE